MANESAQNAQNVSSTSNVSNTQATSPKTAQNKPAPAGFVGNAMGSLKAESPELVKAIEKHLAFEVIKEMDHDEKKRKERKAEQERAAGN